MELQLDSADYLPHQYKFLTSTSKILALVSGFGAGKTYGFLRKVLLCHLFEKREDGFSNGWVIYPTLELANELFVEDFKLLLDDLDIRYEWNSQKGRFKTDYGWIKIYTLEQPNRMVGANLTFVGFDEFDTVKTSRAMACFRKAIGRLRGSEEAKLFIVTTPEGFKATYKIFVENQKSSQEIIHAKTTDNPYLPESYIELLKQQYDPILLKAYVDGKFVNLTSGTVYYAFDREVHVSNEEMQIMNGYPVNICFDFNVYPYSLSWNQRLNDQNIRWLGEWVSKNHSNTEQACDELTKLLPRDIDVVVYGDASGRNGAANSNLTNYQIIDNKLKNYFRSVQYRVPMANPGVRDRINCTNAKLAKNHILLNKSCIKLIQDFEQVIWNEKGNEIDKADIHRTHSSDGAGYYLYAEFPIQDFRKEQKSRSL